MELASKVTDSIQLYILITCISRSLVWLSGFIILTVIGFPMDSLKNLYEKLTKKHIVNYNSSDYKSLALIYKLLYILRKINKAIWDKKHKLKVKSNETPISLVLNNILKVDILNVVLLLFATTLVENNGDIDVSIYVLKNLVLNFGRISADFISIHTDKLIMGLIVVLGFWVYNLGSEWSKLKTVARNDLKIKEMVFDIYSTIDSNCDYLYQLRYAALDNCKIKLTASIGYDYGEDQLIRVRKVTSEKEDIVAIQAVGQKISKLTDLLKEQNSNYLTGIKSSYYSFFSLLIDELYSVDDVVFLEKMVLNYDESDSRFQYVRDYFKKYHNLDLRQSLGHEK